MDTHSQRMHLRRILAGEVRCQMASDTIIVHCPTLSLLSEAEALYSDVFYEASFVSPSEDEILDVLNEIGIWTDDDEARLNSLPTTMEAMRVEAWQAHLKFQNKRVDRARKQLKRLTKEWGELYGKRHEYDYLLPSGIAHLAKTELLLYASSNFDTYNASRFRTFLNQYYTAQLDELQLRDLAKTAIVRNLWACKTFGQFYETSIGCWTNEQLGLVAWLSLYDNIYENMDCPPVNVVNDDILIDGWLIVQSKEREKDKVTRMNGGDKHTGSNKPGLQEVYIPADTPEDAARIHDMNDEQTRFQKRQREKLIATQGKVDETKMPDSQLLMRQQALQEILDRSKRR